MQPIYQNSTFHPQFSPDQELDFDPVFSFACSLFCLYEHQRPLALYQFMLSHAHSSAALAKLISSIWKAPFRTEQEKLLMLKGLTTHLPLVDVLPMLMRSDPVCFLCVIEAFNHDHPDLIKTISKNEDRVFFDDLLRLSCHITYPQHQSKEVYEAWNALIIHLTDRQLYAFAATCCKMLPVHEQGKIYCIIEKESIASFFTETFYQLCVQTKHGLQKLKSLIESLADELPTHCKRRPVALTALLKFRHPEIELMTELATMLPQFSLRAQSLILWCADLNDLKHHFIQTHDAQDRLVVFLDSILPHCGLLEEKITYLNVFLEIVIKENTLLPWLRELLRVRSPAISLIWIALPQKTFNYLIKHPDQKLRTELLCLSLPDPEIVLRLSNRTSALLKAPLDIPSQNAVEYRNQLFATWLTFQELEKYILEGINGQMLGEVIAVFEEDLHRVPPFLFALCTHDLNKSWIAQAARYLSTAQISAISTLLQPEKEGAALLQQIFDHTIESQWHEILKNLNEKMLEHFLRNKSRLIQEKSEQIQQNHREINNRLHYLNFSPQQNSRFIALHEDTQKMCLLQSQLVNTVLHPQNRIITHYAQGAAAQELKTQLESAAAFKSAIEGPFGFYQRLDQVKPNLSSNQVSLEQIPPRWLTQHNIPSLADVGLREPQDLEHLGITETTLADLKPYLAQNDLLKLWNYLKMKNLPSIHAIVEAAIVDSPQDLFVLITLVRKLGWKE